MAGKSAPGLAAAATCRTGNWPHRDEATQEIGLVVHPLLLRLDLGDCR